MRLPPAVLRALVTSWAASGQTYTISTFAGGGLPVNIPGTSASLYGPESVAVDKAGNVFFTDLHDVLRLDAATGVLTLVAGNGTPGFGGDNGPATSAQLSYPSGIAVDAAGNLYIVDGGNTRIRKVSNGVITTVEGNVTNPTGVAVDAAGNLYIADGNRIRKVANGVITTVAGNGTYGFSGDNGPAASAQLSYPSGVAVDAAGNLYIADRYSSRVRKVANGVIATVAGNGTYGFSGDNGPAISASLNNTDGVAVDAAGNLYIADGNRIRKVANGVITTVAGNGTYGFSGDNGPATSAELDPSGITVDAAGNLYITDPYSSRVRKVANGVITTVAGNGTQGFSGDNGPAISASLSNTDGVAVDAAGNLYIADGNRIRKVANGVITTVAGNGIYGFSGDNGPAISASLSNTDGVAVDTAGNLYIADTGNCRVRKVANGVITTVAGNGRYVTGHPPSECSNGTYGFSGDNGPATSAELDPSGVAVDAAGNLYIAGGTRIRKVANGVITTVAGNGALGFSGDNGPATSAQLYYTTQVAADAAGNLYIADNFNNRIRKVTNGVITTVAGNGTKGFSGDNGPATRAQLGSLADLAVDPAGRVYFSDATSNRVRLLTPGAVPTISPNGVVPNNSVVPAIQSGSWATIWGSNLASETFLWNADFPTSLGGTSITINNKPAYLWFVSPFQINLQVPDEDATGLVSVVVTTASGTAASTVILAPYAPSFSLLGNGKNVVGEIATPNGTGAYAGGTYDLVGPSNTFSFKTRPVSAGETLTLFGVGFGPTSPSVPAGKVFSGSAPAATPVTITIGGVKANVVYAGITGAGLYQFNLIVPPNTGSGDQSLQAIVNGFQTPPGPVVTVQ